MAKWKLCRQTYGNEIYEFTEGDEVTIGRGTQNTIVLSSLNVSRKHCVIDVKKDEVIIKDLNSANGIFVGLKKIPPNTSFPLSNNDIIGLGWTDGAPLAEVNDDNKFVFKLLRTTNDSSIIDRIKFQDENEHDVLPATVINESINLCFPETLKPTSSLSLKRKLNIGTDSLNENSVNGSNIKKLSLDSIENSNNLGIKKFKYNFSYEEPKEEPNIKIENEDEQYEAFNIKQECFDDEVQVIDSDSDSEQWYIRLSQNSPRKSFTSFNETRKSDDCQQDSSYSQLDDDVIIVENDVICNNESDEELYKDDLFTSLPQPQMMFHGPSDKPVESTDIKKEHTCRKNLTSQLTSACYDSTTTTTTIKDQSIKELPILNPPMNVLHSTSNKKTKIIDNEVNKNSINNKMVELSNSHKSSKEKSKEVVCLPKPPSVVNICESTSNNIRLEMDNKINNLKDLPKPPSGVNIIRENTSNNMSLEMDNKINNIKDKESKCKVVCETDTKKINKISSESIAQSRNEHCKKIQLTDNTFLSSEMSSSKGKRKKKNDYNKSRSSKIQITNSQKEERKKKLREIAAKDKGQGEQLCNSNLVGFEECSTITSTVSAKVTTSNRGAFLIETKQVTSMPTSKRIVKQDNKETKKDTHSTAHVNDCKQQDINTIKSLQSIESKDKAAALTDSNDKVHQYKIKKKTSKSNDVYNKHRTLSADSTLPPPADVPDIALSRRHSDNSSKDGDKKKHSTSLNGERSEKLMSKNQTERKENVLLETCNKKIMINSVDDKTSNSTQKEASADIQLQNKIETAPQKIKPASKSSMKTILKTMKENTEPNRKSCKRVTFSEIQPQILEFEIEHGHKMKKTSNVKSVFLSTQYNSPVFSLQKIALMKILRWNPQWLEEQNNFSEPPPILGHNNVPLAILHSFSSHTQYVELIGDLLLMEIWECLTQGYVKTRNDYTYLQMRVESLPLVPPQRRGLELINLSVNVSMPTVQAHTIPREGEIMMIQFGEDGKIFRFFFVLNVRCLPSPPNNINSFYSISLQTSFTEKIRTLQRGAVMYGRSLAYINKDLRLFEAMDYLSSSPLSEVILDPQPSHFLLDEADRRCSMESQWSRPLNDSQRKAVMCAVSAAQGERPRIHMIQGPPGTGKSRVICAIVMEYFYDAAGKKQRNLGKILLCATSNAAVDELVIRLLDIRQSLPQPERLKLVRVGRVEAMHPRARDISSVKLAQRDAARLQPDPTLQPSALSAEISLLEAKKNMWETKAMSTEDDARKAYCQNRVAEIAKKITMFRNGSGGGAGAGAGLGPEQLAQAERRVLEGADVVLTTLASAHSHKMRGLSGRIALCVVDEAGQAIEPETLVPVTLGVTHLALVGDPQQLPGFICSQRAKQHGLGESLFSRLSSCAETWTEGGPILLDRQYRMHPHIADYPNRAFYDGRVHNEPPPALDTVPYFVLGIISGDNGQDSSGANDAEAWGAARVALALRSRLRTAPLPSAAHSLAVITPYAAQRDLVRHHLRALLQAEDGGSGSGSAPGEEGEVEVNTVDSFQGQERSVVVVSLARSHGLGFLAAAGRMNVMLTRAKHTLVLCLNPRALEKNHQWRSLVEDAQKRNLYGILPIQMCQSPTAQRVSHQDILKYLSSNTSVNIRNVPHQTFRRRPNKNKRRRNKNKKISIDENIDFTCDL